MATPHSEAASEGRRSRGASVSRSGAATPKPSSKYMFVVTLPVPNASDTHEIQVGTSDTPDDVINRYIQQFQLSPNEKMKQTWVQKVRVMMTKVYMQP